MSVFKPRKKFDRWGADSFTVDELVRAIRGYSQRYTIPSLFTKDLVEQATREVTFIDALETARRINALRASCGVEPDKRNATVKIRKPPRMPVRGGWMK